MTDPDDDAAAVGGAGSPPPAAPDVLSPEIQGVLGRELRRSYMSLVDEPLPDRFSKLLDQLAKEPPPTKPDQGTST